jgi:uncharacterized protein (TIGR03067 family)
VRRTVYVLSAVLLVGVGLGSDSPKEYDGATVSNTLEGSWRLTEFEFKGARAKSDVQGVLTFRGGAWSLMYGNVESLAGRYRIDTTHQPPHLDWIVSTEGELKGRTLRFIFQIDGDTLRIGFKIGSDWSRPQGFDRDVAFETYKRMK